MRWPAESIWQYVSPLLPGFTVEILPEVDSTNSELMRRARSRRCEPVLLVGEHQNAGRGRLGRQWASEAGDSLTFSLSLPLAPVDWSGLSLAVGLAVAEALHPRIGLKWPNDLWVDDRKLGGILVETVGFGDRPFGPRQAVVGIGINVAPPSQDQALSTRPAALAELWPQATAAEALERIASPLVQALQAFEQFGFGPFRSRYEARDVLRDRHVVLSDGTEGTSHGVAEDGSLLVHTAAGMQTISSSEVSVRPAA